MFKQKSVVHRGFLLPDVMIAVFVVAGALVAILSVLAPTIKAEFFKRDQMIATGLAQEGIEIIRNVRDNNWKESSGPNPIVGVATNAFAGNFPANGNHCIDYTMESSEIKISSPSCTLTSSKASLLQQDPSSTPNGLYSVGVGSPGKFKRIITIAGGNDEKTITSEVTWGVGASKHTVTLSDTLRNWGDK